MFWCMIRRLISMFIIKNMKSSTNLFDYKNAWKKIAQLKYPLNGKL